jgi:hypothetical protein
VLAPALYACNFTPDEEEENESKVQTMAAQTIDANGLQLTLDAQSALLTAQAQTMQPAQPQLPEQTQPPGEPVQTEPPQAPQQTEPPPMQTEPPPAGIRVVGKVEANCRSGPGPEYPKVGYLLVGQEAPALGTNQQRTWWLIEDPKKPGQNCWVWGENVTVLGDPGAAPVVEAPPPPQPAGAVVEYNASFANVHPCGGVAMVVFMIGNMGSEGLRSSSITIKDLNTDTFIAGPEPSNNPFMPGDMSCPPGGDALGPGGTAFIAKGVGAMPPPGTKGRGIILLCTEPNQGGICIEKKVTFVFP